jgi:hypothetical protein
MKRTVRTIFWNRLVTSRIYTDSAICLCLSMFIPNENSIDARWHISTQWGQPKSDQIASVQANHLHKCRPNLMLSDSWEMIILQPFASEKNCILWRCHAITIYVMLPSLLLHDRQSPSDSPLQEVPLSMLPSPPLPFPRVSWSRSACYRPHTNRQELRQVPFRCWYRVTRSVKNYWRARYSAQAWWAKGWEWDGYRWHQGIARERLRISCRIRVCRYSKRELVTKMTRRCHRHTV